MNRYTWPVMLSLFGFPASAWAHLVNQDVGEFYAGMLHPLTSAEHLIPALALGLLAGREGIRPSRWVLLAFPTALMLGIWMGGGAAAPPAFSQAVNLAVIALLGMLLAISRSLPVGAVIGVAGATGLVLGWRSGIDMAAAGVGVQFIPGVALAGFLLIALVSPWIAQGGSHAMRTALCATGWAVTLAGVYLMAKFLLAGDATAFRSIGLPTQESLTTLVESETLSLPVMAGAFLAAMAWGAAHALTPGHGKAIVGAYLIGSRGTPMHAVYLGLTVTATHTFGIFALGFVALFASHYLLPDQLMPWLAAGSGVIVLAIGASMFVKRIRPLLRMRAGSARHGHDHRHHHVHDHHDHHQHVHDHGHPHGHHTHAHLPPDTGADGVSWRALLGLGISGGLLPCPAALVLLLAAIAMERTALGILLVVAFSIGLSGVLTAVGLLFIKGSRLLRGIPLADALSPYAPAFSALLIFAIGLVITVNAVAG